MIRVEAKGTIEREKGFDTLSAQILTHRQFDRIHIRHWGESIAAVAVGILMGILAAMPYESWLPASAGMSGSIGTVVRSLIVAIGLSGLHMVPAEDLVFDASQM